MSRCAIFAISGYLTALLYRHEALTTQISGYRAATTNQQRSLAKAQDCVQTSQKVHSPDGAHVAYDVTCKPQQGHRALFQIVVLDRTGKETAHARFLINEEIGEVCKPEEGAEWDR